MNIILDGWVRISSSSEMRRWAQDQIELSIIHSSIIYLRLGAKMLINAFFSRSILISSYSNFYLAYLFVSLSYDIFFCYTADSFDIYFSSPK